MYAWVPTGEYRYHYQDPWYLWYPWYLLVQVQLRMPTTTVEATLSHEYADYAL